MGLPPRPGGAPSGSSGAPPGPASTSAPAVRHSPVLPPKPSGLPDRPAAPLGKAPAHPRSDEREEGEEPDELPPRRRGPPGGALQLPATAPRGSGRRGLTEGTAAEGTAQVEEPKSVEEFQERAVLESKQESLAPAYEEGTTPNRLWWRKRRLRQARIQGFAACEEAPALKVSPSLHAAVEVAQPVTTASSLRWSAFAGLPP
ncbi:hypothetical protein JCM10295v2_000864 [Rhodotorula toruloides]